MMRIHPLLLALAAALPAASLAGQAELPPGCAGDVPGQDATMACFERTFRTCLG